MGLKVGYETLKNLIVGGGCTRSYAVSISVLFVLFHAYLSLGLAKNRGKCIVSGDHISNAHPCLQLPWMYTLQSLSGGLKCWGIWRENYCAGFRGKILLYWVELQQEVDLNRNVVQRNAC